MKRYHLNLRNGDVGVCKAEAGKCPFSREELHFPDDKVARAFYEKVMDKVGPPKLRKASGEITKALVHNNHGRYPEAIIRHLGRILESHPSKTMVVLPAGSDLYNTSIPDRPVHDYDFMAFVEPFAASKSMKIVMEGDIDLKIVSVDKISTLSARSAEISESIFAHQNSSSSLLSESSPWTPYLNSLRLSEEKYFDLLDDIDNSLRTHFKEPVSMDDKEGFRAFKHTVRRGLYRKRWGSGVAFNPRLSENERELFLKALKSGRMESIYKNG